MVHSMGKAEVVHVSNVKYLLPADRVISKLPDYQSFGRQSKMRKNLQHIPNLKWDTTIVVNTNFSAVTSKLDSATSVIESYIITPMVSTNSMYNMHPQTI